MPGIEEKNRLEDERTAELRREVEERKNIEAELRAAKDSAERALIELRQAKDSLLQSEKWAALGSMVAGISHEINTPIGVGVTAASFLFEQTAKIGQEYDDGSMKRSTLKQYLSDACESAHLILTNLQRTSELVSNFKKMAVDQSSGDRRSFDIGDYLKGVLISIGPILRKIRRSINVRLNCETTIEINSFPGSLAQVITNLVINAVTHAFDENSSGFIDIDVAIINNDVIEIICRDDGKGISCADLPRIFDPFFTTRRGDGGSGLGLYIVQDIVTTNLGGSIEVKSEVGRGTAFIIRMPLHAE